MVCAGPPSITPLEQIPVGHEQRCVLEELRAEGEEDIQDVVGRSRSLQLALCFAALYGWSNGVMTINEVRALENLPPVEGGEVPRMQMQFVPINQISLRSTQPGTSAALPVPDNGVTA